MSSAVVNVRTSPTVRIFTPVSGKAEPGRLFDVRQHRSFRAETATLRVMEALHAPRERLIYVSELAEITNLKEVDLVFLLRALEKVGLLRAEDSPSDDRFAGENSDEETWRGSLEYHLLTRNFRFLNYSPGSDGPRTSLKRMDKYASVEPDTARLKRYEKNLARIALAPPGERTETDDRFDRVFGNTGRRDVGDQGFNSGLVTSLSFAFGVSARATCPWSKEPFVRRTSPSGGSRHPTEGYLLRLDLESPRMWHVQSDEPCLVEILHGETEVALDAWKWAKSHFADASHAVIFTSVFARNMFRYREPRTFRSVHMDAGHVTATMQLALSSNGIASKIECALPFRGIAELLRVDPFVEGPMCAVFTSLGDRHALL